MHRKTAGESRLGPFRLGTRHGMGFRDDVPPGARAELSKVRSSKRRGRYPGAKDAVDSKDIPSDPYLLF